MKRSISECAKLMGISVRTLHYYDEIGLLKPTETSVAGYRYYDDEAIGKLQQILFFRELAFSLKDIADILSRPDYDRQSAIRRHRELLLLKREQLDGMIALADETLGGKPMNKNQKPTELEEAKARYAAEVAERWGKTDAYAENQKRHAVYDDAKEAAISEEADAIFAAFAKCMDQGPASERAQALVQEWQAHISRYHYPCTKEILRGLGLMYSADERFGEYLGRFGDGNAQFISQAIECFTKEV